METQFEIVCRSIRIGSLKAFPPKQPKKLKLSMQGLRFYICLENKPGLDSIKINIPLSNITLIEGHIGRGCPVLWFKTDVATARKIRRQCFMLQRKYPAPSFDPQSKELAEQRIAIIPHDDPIENREVVKFRTIMRLIAADRRIVVEDIFTEMSRVFCNQQLVECTRYISTLKKLQTAMKMKQESKSDSENVLFRVKSEAVSETPEIQMNKTDDETIIILSSSEEEAEAEKKELVVLSTKKDTVNRTDVTENSKFMANAMTSDSDHLPVFNVRAMQKLTEPPPIDTLSPDLLDFEEDCLQLVQEKNMTDVVNKASNQNISNFETEEDVNQIGGDSNCISLKRKAESGSDNKSTTSNKARRRRNENDREPTKSPPPAVVSSENESKSSISPVNLAATKEADASTVQKTSEISASNKDNSDRKTSETEVDRTLPNSKINVKSIRGTASLTSDMLTLHQDMESMLSATPLCICVVKSRYVINLSNHKITCMALDNIDGRLTGCINQVNESHMMRPSNNLPAQGLCRGHKTRMLAHECCPGCGTFCAGGTFLVCNSTKDHQHRFHRNCLILTRHSMDCPHCGCPMSDVQEVTIDPNDEFLKKYEQDGSEVVEKSPNKQRQPCYPTCVVHIAGVTTPVPARLLFTDDVKFCPESLDVLVSTVEEELPKKLRFQEKNLVQLVRQGDLAKTVQLLCGTAGNPDARDSKMNNLRTVLHEAVIGGNFPMVHALVTAGANVNAQDMDGKTPVYFAEEQKRIDLIKYLVTCGANLRHGDKDGMTPLHYAARDGRLETCLALLKYDRKAINSLDDGGWTPLVWAAEHRRTETARCLTYFDTSMHSVDEEGNICLQWAALAGNKEILLMCLRRNSSVDHQNLLGDTALHIAARQDNLECVVTLLAWGANPLIKNREGDTAAKCSKDPSLCHVVLLMNSMTRISITDHKGFEPLDRERLLSSDISRGKEKIAISCVNAVDEAPCPVHEPHEFLYISKNIHKYTSVNAIITNTNSCKCLHDCMSCECGRCWYDSSGNLLPSFDFVNPPDIYECNPFCKCPSTCRNRVIQKGGVRFRIQIFRTTNIGWGVRALEPIKSGSYICEFIGEVISDGDAREDDFYLFDLDKNPGGSYCIDGRSYGNVSRYINHHCEPNLIPVRFFYDHQDKNFPRIAFFASRNISPGEQLCFDYGEGFWDEKRENFTCECGAPTCRYSERAFRQKRKMQEAEAEMEVDREEEDKAREKS